MRSTILLAVLVQSIAPPPSFAAAFSLPSIWSEQRAQLAQRISTRATKNTTTIPAAISIGPSQNWDGNDGPWSSFPLQVGIHPQNIRVFVSTAAYVTVSIATTGCPAGYVDDCGNQRGFLFNPNQSLTYVQNSVFDIGVEQNLGMDTNADAGFDTITLGWQGSGGPTVQHATLFNANDPDYWLGIFGVNPLPANFSTLNNPQPSYMTQLVNNNTIPSLTYGYTAGNQYRLNKVFGSLVLGGYDQNRFDPTKNVSIGFYADIQRDLLVNIQSITTDKGSPSNLLPGGPITAYIDSTIAQLWLPQSACTAFEEAFGLTYDNASGYYLVNSTLHSTLLEMNPNVTFTIGSQASGGPSVNITLPYGAFDLTIKYPAIPNNASSSYFPLKRAANDTQYTLGRTFLQEAYLIADYDRSNFTIAPCIWDSSKVSSSSIVSILRANETNVDSGSSTDVGAIAGGVVGGVVALVAIIGGVLFWLRRRQRGEKKRLAELAAQNNEDGANDGKPFISGELSGQEIHELNNTSKSNFHEMDTPTKGDPNSHGYSEMEGGEYFVPGKGVPAEMEGQHAIYEMPGSEVQELADTGRRPPNPPPKPR